MGTPRQRYPVSPSALITLNRGRYGSVTSHPGDATRSRALGPAEFEALVEAFRARGFRPVNAWYLNDTANIAYACAAPDGVRLRQPGLRD